jgi:hypothetical protein
MHLIQCKAIDVGKDRSNSTDTNNKRVCMKLALALIPLALVGCAGGEAIRTSANTMIVQAGAAPACGPGGGFARCPEGGGHRDDPRWL